MQQFQILLSFATTSPEIANWIQSQPEIRRELAIAIDL